GDDRPVAGPPSWPISKRPIGSSNIHTQPVPPSASPVPPWKPLASGIKMARSAITSEYVREIGHKGEQGRLTNYLLPGRPILDRMLGSEHRQGQCKTVGRAVRNDAAVSMRNQQRMTRSRLVLIECICMCEGTAR